jgi:hypothetical protein
MKILVVILLGCIVVSLGQALHAMSSGPEHSERVVRALSVRIGLSLVLFALLMLGWYLGLITPNEVQ